MGISGFRNRGALVGLPMSHYERRVIKNAAWTVAGNVVYAGCQWGIIVILAKVGSTEMVGQFSMAFAISAPIMLFANLGLRPLQATDANREFQLAEYFGLRVAMIGAGLSLIVVAVVVGRFEATTTLVICFISLGKAVESISDVIYGALQQHEWLDRIARSLMLKGVCSLTLLGGVLHFSENSAYGAGALLVSSVLTLLLYDVRNLGVLRQQRYGWELLRQAGRIIGILSRYDGGSLFRLFKTAAPLGLAAMLVSLNISVPIYFLYHFMGEEAVGVYAGMAYLIAAGSTVVTALGEAAVPRLARYYLAGRLEQFKALLAKFTGATLFIGSAGVVVAYGWGGDLLTFLYRAEYAEYQDVLVWMAVAGTMSYVSSSLGYAMTAARQRNIQVPLFSFVALLNGAACAVLVPMHQIQGAAQAMLLSATATAALAAVVNITALYYWSQS
jgi:O-antigen/teichoic acid export membrane protein